MSGEIRKRITWLSSNRNHVYASSSRRSEDVVYIVYYYAISWGVVETSPSYSTKPGLYRKGINGAINVSDQGCGGGVEGDVCTLWIELRIGKSTSLTDAFQVYLVCGTKRSYPAFWTQYTCTGASYTARIHPRQYIQRRSCTTNTQSR